MTAVPRLYETMHQRISLGIQRERGLKRRLFERAVAIGRKRLAGEPLTLADRLLDPVLDRLVRDKVRARFGGRLKAMVSGGAPLNPEIGGFFLALGVTLLQGYGQTEAAPVIACNPPDRIRIDTVGPALDGVEIRIADDGEILVARRQCHAGLLERPRGDRAHPGRWLAAYRRYRPSRSRRLSAHHRPEARFHQEFGWRHDLAGARRGRADPGAGDRAGDGVGRPPAVSGRGPRPRPRFRRRLRRASTRLPAISRRWRATPAFTRHWARSSRGSTATSSRPSACAAS